MNFLRKMRISLILIVLLLFSCTAFIFINHNEVSATDITSNITSDTTWTTSGSPYIIKNTIDVNSGVLLTINAGVTVKFNSGCALQVKGSLQANGTSSNTIMFTANTASPSRGYWDRIQFQSTCKNTFLNYCIIQYADFGLNPVSSAPSITNCTIQHNDDTGIYVNGNGTGYMRVENNYIYDNGFGISVWSGTSIYKNCRIETTTPFDGVFTCSTPIFINCTINNSDRSGVLANVGGHPTFINSTIKASDNEDLNICSTSSVTMLNSSFNVVKFGSNSKNLIVQWFLDVKVLYQNGTPLINPDIRIRDNSNGTFDVNLTGNKTGSVRLIPCTEYIRNTAGKCYLTPHFVEARKDQYFGNNTIQVNNNTLVTITVKLNNPPSIPTNLTPNQTIHDTTPDIVWTPSFDLDFDPILYNLSLYKIVNSSYLKIFSINTTSNYFNIANPLLYGNSYFIELYAIDLRNGKSEANATFSVVNTPPTKPIIMITPPYPTTKDDLNCTIVTKSIDIDIKPIDPITYTYHWYKNGVLQSAYTEENVTKLFSFIPNSATTQTDIWKCNVTPSDGIEDGPYIENTVIIKNIAPIVQNPINNFRIDEDTVDSTTVNLKNVFYDSDGDSILFTKFGNVNITVNIDQSTGAVAFIPKTNWNGKENITFLANDSYSETFDDVMVTVGAIDDPPISVMNPHVIFDEDTIDTSLNLIAMFIDPENDPLTFRYEDNKNLTITILINGTVELKPVLNWNGNETLIFYANDSMMEICGTVLVTVMPVNDPPEINIPVEDFSMVEDTINAFGINLRQWFKDIDMDPLTFSCANKGNITVNIFNNGTVTLVPSSNWSGVEVITFFANDSISEVSDTVAITVLPVNDPPFDAKILFKDWYYVEGQNQSAYGTAKDVDIPYGDILTFTWTSNITGNVGTGMDINLSLPAGMHRITLNVTDTKGAWCVTSSDILIIYIPGPSEPDDDINPDDDVNQSDDDVTPDDDVIANITDTDKDGLDDAWEILYFANLDQKSEDDPDMDGKTNLQEFNAGTDPTKSDLPVDDDADDDDSNSNMAMVISGIIAGLVLLLFIIGVAVFLFMRKKKQEPAEQKPIQKEGDNVPTSEDIQTQETKEKETYTKLYGTPNLQPPLQQNSAQQTLEQNQISALQPLEQLPPQHPAPEQSIVKQPTVTGDPINQSTGQTETPFNI